MVAFRKVETKLKSVVTRPPWEVFTGVSGKIGPKADFFGVWV
jgi:hypothetical protein